MIRVFKKISASRFAAHLLFWMMFLVSRLTSSISTKSLIADYWWGDWAVLHLLVVELLHKAIFAYGVVYFLVPRYLDTKRYVLFALHLVGWFYLVIWCYIAIHFYYLEKIYTIHLWWDKESMLTMTQRMTNWGFLTVMFSNFLVPTIILMAIKFYRKKMQFSQIEEEKNKMELKVLKNQLNPHFLFNTLNNLYSFVVTGSAKAPDMILRLSGILDYVLYKSQHNFVRLGDEVETIENFIALEKIRYGERLLVDCQTSGSMELPITPLLLLSMVENAFKHGASGDLERPEIKIDITTAHRQICCKVWNTKTKQKGELNDAYKEGIGLSNIKRQLDLLYPKTSELNIEEDEESFLISLTLNLDYE